MADGLPYPNAMMQWAGDNDDHNLQTIDGQGTFHGMGIIAVFVFCTITGEVCIPRTPCQTYAE